jgi:GNAT superfamily N-acetyltransferase
VTQRGQFFDAPIECRRLGHARMQSGAFLCREEQRSQRVSMSSGHARATNAASLCERRGETPAVFRIDLRADISVVGIGMFVHRLAIADDMPALQQLMTAAIRELLPQFLPPEKVAASFAVMGVDSQLIEDGTYLILEQDGVLAGCGGWSRRATLFGHNHTTGRDSRLLDPKCEAARVRAMYTAPQFVRRGVGRRILELCEAATRAEGFARVELGATKGGEPLYRACGYVEIERLEVPTPGGVTVPITRMGKQL